jgi:hypothetical protein
MARIIAYPDSKAFQVLEPECRLTIASIGLWNELRLSQTQVARMIGMQQSAISRLEYGGLNTTIGTLPKVADALDLELELKPRARGCSKSKRLKATAS